MSDQSPHAEDLTEQDSLFHELLDMLVRINNALDQTIYLLAENHSESCARFVRELLRIVIKINVDLDEFIVAQSGEERDHLAGLAEQCMAEVADAETRFFNKLQENQTVFEAANKMVLQALDELDLQEQESSIKISVGAGGHRAIWLEAPGGISDGARIEFVENAPERVQVFYAGKLHSSLDISSGGEAGLLDVKNQQDESKSTLPLIGSAALLMAAVIYKGKKMLSKPAKVEQQVEQQELQNARTK